MEGWAACAGRILRLLDPTVGPQGVLEALWADEASLPGVAGIWCECRKGRLEPAGVHLVGDCPSRIRELAAGAGRETASLPGPGPAIVARMVRDGNVPIAPVAVVHRGAPDLAAFLVDAIARYLVDRLRIQLEARELAEENHHLRNELEPRAIDHPMVTVSGRMEALIKAAVRAAGSNATVLIEGETGTGKECFARLVHAHSGRSHSPMVSLNAGALSPTLLESELFGHVVGAFTGATADRRGLFEVASGGTLFLDEVGELSAEAQVRLLRVLQDRTVTRVGSHAPRPVDTRVIAATHRDLEREVAEGRFRSDLYYRLNVVMLRVPPLRERVEDVAPLVHHFLQRFSRENYKRVEAVAPRTLELLRAYPWPGNVRELENCVQKVVVLATDERFREEFLPGSIRAFADEHPPTGAAAGGDGTDPLRAAVEAWARSDGPDVHRCQAEVERILIEHALARHRGVKLRAAADLGINRVTLDRKIAEYGLCVRRGIGIVDPAEERPHHRIA